MTEVPVAGESLAGSPYARTLGTRLRRVRAQQGLSLLDVERETAGEFKASVLGAYERGERALSIGRLRALAEFYRIPLSQLVPTAPVTPETPAPAPAGVRIDLTRLDSEELAERDAIRRFVAGVQTRRGDYNGRVITLRRSDLRTLAALVGVAPDELRDRLEAAGVVTPAVPVA